MPQYHLAQLNIAKAKEPLESPSMADFVANLEASSQGVAPSSRNLANGVPSGRPLHERSASNDSTLRPLVAGAPRTAIQYSPRDVASTRLWRHTRGDHEK